jgi:hypothetical protein
LERKVQKAIKHTEYMDEREKRMKDKRIWPNASGQSRPVNQRW